MKRTEEVTVYYDDALKGEIEDKTRMAELINLNKARKAKAKSEKSAQAAENRILYGISTHVRKIEKTKQKRDAEKVDAHRLKSGPDNKNG